MEYHLKPLRWAAISTFAIVFIWVVLSDYYGFSIGLFLFYLLFVVGLALAIRLKFTIKEDHLIYHVFLFKKAIINKELYPNQVEKIKFIRADWTKKAAIIKVDQRSNIRLAILQPPEAYDHLLTFAENNDIPIAKTEDYLTLERKAKRNKEKTS